MEYELPDHWTMSDCNAESWSLQHLYQNNSNDTLHMTICCINFEMALVKTSNSFQGNEWKLFQTQWPHQVAN